MPRAMPPQLDEKTSYKQDFGAYGDDPMARTALTEAEMTMHATSNDLSQGTQRNTWQLPGYTGFQCATKHNPVAMEQCMGCNSRRDTKVRAPPACIVVSVAIP